MFYLKWKKASLAAVFMLILVMLAKPVDTSAKIKEVSALENPQWTIVGQVGVTQEESWLQSMCVTENYIVCFENTSNNDDDPTVNDYV